MVMLSVRQRINGSYQGILFARDYIALFPTFFLRIRRAKSRAASQLVRTMAGDSRNLLHTWLEYYISHHKPCFFKNISRHHGLTVGKVVVKIFHCPSTWIAWQHWFFYGFLNQGIGTNWCCILVLHCLFACRKLF